MSLDPAALPALTFLEEAATLRQRHHRWRPETLRMFLLGTELALLLLIGSMVAQAMPASLGQVSLRSGAIAGALSGAVMLVVGRGWPDSSVMTRASSIALGCGVGGVFVLSLGAGWRSAAGWTMEQLALAGLLLGIVRALYHEFSTALLADGRLATHFAVIGDGLLARRLCADLRRQEPALVKLVGRYRVREDARGDDRGPVAALLSDCRREAIDAVIVALEPDEEERLSWLDDALRTCVQTLYFVPDLMASAPPHASQAYVGETPVLLIRQPPMFGRRGLLKAVFDRVVALALIVFMAPLLIAIAGAIRWETRGPILFRQLRVGYNNRLFYILKFRSMHPETTDRLAKQQTTRGDKRVTKVGRFIRRFSLDELPQLLNVLFGDMSLVGPRPHAPGTSVDGRRIHLLVPDYACRHRVRPGVTGLAQVRGLRGGLYTREQVQQRIAADFEYIERWSFWLDLRILIGTCLVELREGRGV